MLNFSEFRWSGSLFGLWRDKTTAGVYATCFSSGLACWEIFYYGVSILSYGLFYDPDIPGVSAWIINIKQGLIGKFGEECKKMYFNAYKSIKG